MNRDGLPVSLGYLFDGALERAPEAAAILERDESISYARLDARCNRVANGLASLGVRAGDRVALMFTNDARFVECFFGAIRLGAVALPLNTRMSDEPLEYVLRDADAPVVIANQSQADRALGMAGRVAGLRPVLLDESGTAQVFSEASAALPRRAVESDEICMQPYTSGSTGKPKGVQLTHRGQIWNTDVVRRAIEANSTERALVAVPPVS